MKNLIKESNWTLKASKEISRRTDRNKKFKKVHLKGKTAKVNDYLKTLSNKRYGHVQDKYGLYLDGKAVTKGKYEGYYAFVNPKPDGTYDYTDVKSKFAEFIKDISEKYEVVLDIDEMIEVLTQAEASSNNQSSDEEDYKDIPSKEEIRIAKSGVEAFKETLLSIADSEEFLEKIKLMSDISQGNDSGNISKLTPANLWMVKTQKPNATLVMSRSSWRKYFNRTVNDRAKKIVIWTGNPVSKGVEQSEKEKYLQQKGVSNYSQLSKADQYELKTTTNKANLVKNTEKGVKWSGSLGTYYDYSDTTQIPETEDNTTELVQNILDSREKAKNASERLKAIGGLDATKTNTKKSEKITLVYNGLIAYKEDTSISIPNFQPKDNPTANETKEFTKKTLNILLTQMSDKLTSTNDFVKKFYQGDLGRNVLDQQSEMGAYMFMAGMGIEFKSEEIDKSVLFKGDTTFKQKQNMNKVFKAVEGVVAYLKNFVEVYIEDTQLSEGNGGIDFRMPSKTEVAREFGFTDLLNASPEQSSEEDIQELHERIVRKLTKRI